MANPVVENSCHDHSSGSPPPHRLQRLAPLRPSSPHAQPRASALGTDRYSFATFFISVQETFRRSRRITQHSNTLRIWVLKSVQNLSGSSENVEFTDVFRKFSCVHHRNFLIPKTAALKTPLETTEPIVRVSTTLIQLILDLPTPGWSATLTLYRINLDN